MTTSTLDIADCINETCPWSGEPVQADSLTEYDGKVVGFCNPGCRDKFEAAIRHFDGAEFITATTEEDFRQARTLLREYEDFVEVDLCFQGFEEELGNLERVYGLPGGRFLLLRQGGQTAGCVALRDLGNGVCEMKRLFLRTEFRGKGLGRLCAERIIQTARDMGFVAMRLDTLPIMREAIDLYRSMGFREIGNYAENPVKGALCMELQLTGG